MARGSLSLVCVATLLTCCSDGDWLSASASARNSADKPAYLDPEVDYDGFLPTTDTRKVPIVLNCRMYNIPANVISYLDRHPVSEACINSESKISSINMAFLLPDYTGLTQKNQETMLHKGIAPILRLHLVAGNNSQRSLASAKAIYFTQDADRARPAPSVDGLQCYYAKQGGSGLRDFVCENINDPAQVVTCVLPDRLPNPSCTHYFIAENLALQITYQYRNLPDWKSIRNKVVELMASYSR